MREPIVRFEPVIVRSESTLHSLDRIKQSPCNALLRLKPPIDRFPSGSLRASHSEPTSREL